MNSPRHLLRIFGALLVAGFFAAVGYSRAQLASSNTAAAEPLRTGTPGVLECEGTTAGVLKVGALVFADRKYTVAESPAALQGMNFLRVKVDGGKTLTCTRAGTVWVLTPSTKRGPTVSQAEALLKQGFRPVSLPEFCLLPGNFCTLYQKDCAVGETITFGRWAVPLMRGAAADDTTVVPVVHSAAERERIAKSPIDRHALVTRHNITLDHYDAANPLQVGNGEFAFATDITGLQTFTDQVGTFSNWGWHTFPNPEAFREEETWCEVTGGGGRKSPYAYNLHTASGLTPEQKARAKGAHDWYRRAPHRLHLGRIGFELAKPDGSAAQPADLRHIRQTIDLWTGMIRSSFEFDGFPVEVITCCHPKQDLVAVRVRSKLLATGRLRVFWHFPYVEFNACNPTWKAETDGRHETKVVSQGSNRVDVARALDADRHFVSVVWNRGQWSATGPHRFVLTPSRSTEEFSFVCGFGPQPVVELPGFPETAAASATHWQQFWQSGGAIDLSASTDPRWHELERRIVLSQYLTAVNSTGAAPPQESGLFANSWYGKFHLEMTAWHGVHFVLWGRAPLLDGWMQWMRGPGLESAKRQAAKQGYKGARWMKMISPDPRWESPSGAGPFRLTQQGHAIYWAELMYRERPTRETLEQFRDIVMQSAEFMADFVWWDEKTGRYVLGPPLLTGSESTPWAETYNSTVELSYWFYGLRTAQLWRERLGLARAPKWDAILTKLSKPPVANGLCVDAEPFPAYMKSRHCRPAWLEAYGCMRGDEIDRDAMRHSFDTIWGDIKGGTPWQIWGCDFPMLAMTAARLGRPQDAVDALLLGHPGNTYLPNGFNNAGSRPYLPASGGLLWAVAMMASGWDGCSDTPAPGFPNDGSWVVKCEGLKKSP